MSFPIAVIIMLIAGISGGTVNYLLPSNKDAQRSGNWIQCVLPGNGVTILVPLFSAGSNSFGIQLAANYVNKGEPG